MMIEMRAGDLIGVFVGSIFIGAGMYLFGYCVAKYEDYKKEHSK